MLKFWRELFFDESDAATHEATPESVRLFISEQMDIPLASLEDTMIIGEYADLSEFSRECCRRFGKARVVTNKTTVAEMIEQLLQKEETRESKSP
jgi:hypothetical protein